MTSRTVVSMHIAGGGILAMSIAASMHGRGNYNKEKSLNDDELGEMTCSTSCDRKRTLLGGCTAYIHVCVFKTFTNIFTLCGNILH